MRHTGIKILFKGIRDRLLFPHLNFNIIPNAIPKTGLSQPKMILWLYSLLNEINEINLPNKLGSSYSKPNGFVVRVWSKVLAKNPNNLGNWFTKSTKTLIGTPKSENELLTQLIKLFGGKNSKWTGYVTSGSTEANIFSVWMGRNYFKQERYGGKMMMLINDLTHYSIPKAADMLDIETKNIKISRDWKTDTQNLLSTVYDLHKKGYNNFLIPLTLGYTQTGTNDNFEQILSELDILKKSLNIHLFVWIDAAANGLTLPFTNRGFYPLENTKIATFCLDFHKTGMCPIPSGVVLYQQKFQKYIARKIPYIETDDTSLLGSRSGAAAAGMLALLNTMGTSGFKKNISSKIFRKNKFIGIIKNKLSNIEIVNCPNSLTFGIVSKHPIPNQYLSKYGLYSKKTVYNFTDKKRELYVYKVSFY